jgi:nitrogen regulatory protein P-II 2
MRLITAVIRSFKLEEVCQALLPLGVEGMAVGEVRGFSRNSVLVLKHCNAYPRPAISPTCWYRHGQARKTLSPACLVKGLFRFGA